MIDFIKSLFQLGNYKRLFRWLPVVWRDRDWDWCFLLQILKFKLEQMEKDTKNWYSVKAERNAKEMHVCILLIDRILEDKYADKLWEKHSKEFGPIEYATIFTPKERKFFNKINNYEEYMMKQDINLLFKRLSKHFRTWWD